MSTRARLTLDVMMFLAIALAYAPTITGVSLHEWLSLAIAVTLLVHTVVNWDWVKRAAAGVFERISRTSALNLLVDAALFIAAVTVMLSGLLISQAVVATLGLATAPSVVWTTVHAVSADATVTLLVIHFALHARWMVNALNKVLERSFS